MSSLMYNECKEWIDEMGKSVLMVPSPCGGIFYVDKISMDLTKKYNPHFIEREIKLGSAGLESFATNIARLFPIMESFGGFGEKDLDSFAEVYQNTSSPQRLIDVDCLREKMITGTKVLFATEKFVSGFFDEWKK